MRIATAEFAKLWRTAPLAWFLLAFAAVNCLLVFTGPEPEYPQFVAGHPTGTTEADGPVLSARLASDLAGLTNVFSEFDPVALGEAYQQSLGYQGVVADLMAAKYAQAVPVAAELAAAERALDPYYASDTPWVHGFLFGTLLGAVTLEAFLLAIAAGLQVHAVERHGGPEQLVFTSPVGRRLLTAKLVALLATVAVSYTATVLPTVALAGGRYGLAGIWDDSVGSGFNMIRDVVVGQRPFLTWLDLSVGGQLMLTLVVALGLAVVVGLLAFTAGAVIRNSYLGFAALLLGGGLLLALPIAGGISLFGMLSMLNPVWLWLKQPGWFTEGGLDVLIPHFESAGTAAWLAVGALAALAGYRRFGRVDL